MITVGKSAQIAAAIATAQAAVGAQMAMLIAAGFNYNGVNFQIDQASQLNMTVVMTAFLAGQTNPQNGGWIATNNTLVAMDDAACKAFILSVQAYVTALIFNARSLKNAIAALTTLAAVAAFDIDAGWPANAG